MELPGAPEFPALPELSEFPGEVCPLLPEGPLPASEFPLPGVPIPEPDDAVPGSAAVTPLIELVSFWQTPF